MKLRVFILITLTIVLTVTLGCCTDTGTLLPKNEESKVPLVTISSKPSVDWPMFRFNLNRVGYNPNEKYVKPPLSLKWEHKTDNKI